jgi:predicted ATPase/DNA-binding SARP family transcriptional activator
VADEAVEFRTLGPVELVVNGKNVPLGGPKQRTLMALLLLAEGRATSADRLIDELWGGDPPPTALAALQVYVSGLRKAVGDRLRRSPGGYALDVADNELDSARFLGLIAEARAQLDDAPGQASSLLARALELWRGDAFGGAGDTPAVTGGRLRLEEQRVAAIEDRVAIDLALSRHAQVVAELAELVAADPTRERLGSLYMLALSRCGRPRDAADIYAQLGAALREQLGTEPSEETSALAAAIARRDPTIDAPHSATLPAPVSRFVGRRSELDRLEDLLGRTRMLTLVGPGGAGKTRLAVQLARDVGLAQHPDGVHFVDLAGAIEGDSVAARVAAVLDVRELAGEQLIDSLVARLRRVRVLLVLDNCEHLVRQSNELATALLTWCSGVRILATSRENLGVDGEHVVPVAGLQLPAAGEPPDSAMRADALRLLAARGAAARAGFRIDESNITPALAICRRLDGLPLAIELAAARLRVLSLSEIERRLDRQLDLLASSSRQAADRHATMRATIDWSHQLLEKDERILFRRLAAFTGGFSLEAAEHVGADPDADPVDQPTVVLDTLARLVDRSMLVADAAGPSSRFRMLETIHEYARDQLEESGEGAAARARHAAWYRDLIEGAPQFGGDDHALWMHRIGTELANFRSAMEWTLTDGALPDEALAIATPLWWFWWESGQMREGKIWIKRALDAAGSATSAQRGAALRAAAALARNSGDLGAARELGVQALELQQQHGDPKGLAMAWNSLCMTATGQRDFEAALEYVQQSRVQAELAGEDRGLAVVANNMGTVLRCVGRLDEAEAGFREAVDRFRAAGDVRGEAAAVGNLGVVAARRGDRQEARRLGLESLFRYRELELDEGQLDAIEALAVLEVADGRPESALRLLTVTDRERRRLGAPIFVADESDHRDAAVAATHAALDPSEVAEITSAAERVALSSIVDELLAGRSEVL